LDEIPNTPEKIPAFFFGHGSPILVLPSSDDSDFSREGGPNSPHAAFLKDFGPALLEKYKPKAIIVFSAHWESRGERLVTDYGSENPLFMDFYGFPPAMYDELKFKSRGDKALAEKIVALYKQAGQLARTTPKSEARGTDGKGMKSSGFDHGVSVPFKIMFGPASLDIPVVQVSIDSSLSPEKNWEVGRVISQLREEGYLILSGGLLIHNLRDFSAFIEAKAPAALIDFDKSIIAAVETVDPTARKEAMVNLTQHPAFRKAHPREDHFVPLYVAAGAGGDGETKTICGLYGKETFAFGL
jgi:aromatic ring-opening dioxygenase catalytic subunit (LigB family)